MYVVVAADSWKARHIRTGGQVAVTVPVRRGGIMSLLVPIPPATISFHARAGVRVADSLAGSPLAARLGKLIPAERLNSSVVIEIVPQGEFVTYGVGVPLTRMRHPALARGRAKVT